MGCCNASNNVTMLLTEVRRTNAAMCRACRHYGADSTCRESGAPVTITHERCSVGDCPRGRHTRNGQVTWLKMLWHGVPEPLRWVLLYRRVAIASPLPGCGCSVMLRRLTDRLGLTSAVEAAVGEVRAAVKMLAARI